LFCTTPACKQASKQASPALRCCAAAAAAAVAAAS